MPLIFPSFPPVSHSTLIDVVRDDFGIKTVQTHEESIAALQELHNNPSDLTLLRRWWVGSLLARFAAA